MRQLYWTAIHAITETLAALGAWLLSIVTAIEAARQFNRECKRIERAMAVNACNLKAGVITHEEHRQLTSKLYNRFRDLKDRRYTR